MKPDEIRLRRYRPSAPTWDSTEIRAPIAKSRMTRICCYAQAQALALEKTHQRA